MTPIRVVSLCSGIGGFDLAAEMAGMSIVGQVEIDPFCRRVLAKHWPHVKRLSDLWETKGDEFGAIDVLLAGIPCQPFSFAGKQAGTEDARNLWEPFLSFVEVSRPAWICLENVPGLIRMALDDWLADLGSLGYAALPLAVPAAAVGAPHIRERIFIVAYAQEHGRRTRGPRRLAASGERQCEPIGALPSLADAHRAGFSQQRRAITVSPEQFAAECRSWWRAEPDVDRVADGLSLRVDRLRGLGNAVVPRQAAPILCAIVDAIRAEEEMPWEHEETEPPIAEEMAATARRSSSSAAKGR